MAERFQLPFPMWRVQYQLLGSHSRMVIVVLACIGVLTVGFLGFRRSLNNTALVNVVNMTLNFLGGLNVFLLIFVGCNGVHRAMLRDHDTKMIESHRLTPMSNSGVALGYLFGPTLQILAVFASVVAFGGALCYAAYLPAGQWVGGNVLVLSGAFTLWAMVVFSGMRLAKPISPIGVLIGAIVLGNVGLVLIPGIGLFLSAYSTFLGMDLIIGRGIAIPAAIGAAAVANAVLTLFWISCAAVKYRRPDLPTLGAVRGMGLLLLWLIFGTFGVVGMEYGSRTGALPPILAALPTIQLAATLCISLLVALIPLNGAVECRMLAARGASMRGWRDRVPCWLVVVGAVVLICGVTALVCAPVWPACARVRPWMASSLVVKTISTFWLQTVLAFTLAMLTARAAFVIGYRRFRSPKLAAGILLTAAWILPPMIDYGIAFALRDSTIAIRLSWIFGCSPLGTILVTWTRLRAHLSEGLVLQSALAVLMTCLAYRAGRTRGRDDGGRLKDKG